MSRSAPAAVLKLPPVVAGKRRADGDVLEDGVSVEEVHPKRQVVGSHPFQFGSAEASSSFQLPDAPLLQGP